MKKYEPSSRLKNKRYLDLLNEEYIETISVDDIKRVMENIDLDKATKNKLQAKALIALLYYTGARPTEILELKGRDITRESNYLYISLTTAKRGKPRKLALPIRKPFVADIWKYAQQVFPIWWLFSKYRSKYSRVYMTKVKVDPSGNVTKPSEPRQYRELSARLRYYFKKWFRDIDVCPYLLRHNRFSIMADRGASDEDIKKAKGARSLASVEPYTHLSKKRAKSFGRYI